MVVEHENITAQAVMEKTKFTLKMLKWVMMGSLKMNLTLI